MLSDEEKEAIADFKECYEKDISRYEDFNTYTQYIVKRNGIILNLIEKQSKEIEELKEENLIQRRRLNDAFDRGWIHKAKIKAKIEEVDYKMIAHQDVRLAVKQTLQSLLEEKE